MGELRTVTPLPGAVDAGLHGEPGHDAVERSPHVDRRTGEADADDLLTAGPEAGEELVGCPVGDGRDDVEMVGGDTTGTQVGVEGGEAFENLTAPVATAGLGGRHTEHGIDQRRVGRLRRRARIGVEGLCGIGRSDGCRRAGEFVGAGTQCRFEGGESALELTDPTGHHGQLAGVEAVDIGADHSFEGERVQRLRCVGDVHVLLLSMTDRLCRAGTRLEGSCPPERMTRSVSTGSPSPKGRFTGSEEHAC